jgi:hypothetical protein
MQGVMQGKHLKRDAIALRDPFGVVAVAHENDSGAGVVEHDRVMLPALVVASLKMAFPTGEK